MGNLGGMEVLVILVVALIVLGPTKLPEAARQVGKAVNEVRRISGGFQREMREALQDPLVEADAREKGSKLIADQRAARAGGRHPLGDTTPADTTPADTTPADDAGNEPTAADDPGEPATDAGDTTEQSDDTPET